MAISFSNGLGLFSRIGGSLARQKKSRRSSEVITSSGASEALPATEDAKIGDGGEGREMRKLFQRLNEYTFEG